MKEPDEPMFTLTAMDRHGVEYNGRVRRLMPKECFRLQGYKDKQFNKLVKIGIPEAQLYKMAGNSVTTNVVTAIGRKLAKEVRKLERKDRKLRFYRKVKSIYESICNVTFLQKLSRFIDCARSTLNKKTRRK